MILSSPPIWPGDRSLSKRTTSAFCFLARCGDFDRLAAADVGAGVGRLPLLQDLPDDLRPGGLGQRRQLAQRIARVGGRCPAGSRRPSTARSCRTDNSVRFRCPKMRPSPRDQPSLIVIVRCLIAPLNRRYGWTVLARIATLGGWGLHHIRFFWAAVVFTIEASAVADQGPTLQENPESTAVPRRAAGAVGGAAPISSGTSCFDRPLSYSRAPRRRRHGHRLQGRAARAGAAHRRPEGHQAGNGHEGGRRPV